MLIHRVLRMAVVASLLALGIIPSGADAQGTSRCASWPSSPDASCTGVLPNVARSNSGSITTTQAGQVIANLNVNGSIVVNHDNVTIRNVKITNPRGVAISNVSSGARGLLIEDVELDGTGNTTGASAVDFSNYTLRRAYIHHYGEGPGCASNVVIEDSYMVNFTSFTSQGAHQDGIQCEFGSNVTIRHNTILMNVDGGNAAIVLGGDSVNGTVEHNLLGGGGFTLYMGQAGGTFRHNRFKTSPVAGFGQVYAPSAVGPWSPERPCGNLWYDGASAGMAVPGGGPVSCSSGNIASLAPAPPTNVQVQ